MWNFLVALGAARSLAKTKTLNRIWKPLIWLLIAGVLSAGLIYTYAVLNAVSKRSDSPHVSTHSSH